MNMLTSKGRNIEEAIETGLRLMRLDREDVEVEIIQFESNGFIGMGKKPAIVKLLYKADGAHQYASIEPLNVSNVRSQYNLEDMVESFSFEKDEDPVIHEKRLDGKVWVEDGTIHVKDSQKRYPTIKIGKGIKLHRNGQEVRGKTTIVSENDEIVVDFEETEIQKTDWNVTISKDQLTATLDVKPGFEIHRKLKDHEPETHIELTLEEERKPLNTMGYNEVIQEIESLGIKYGIKEPEISKATIVKEPEQFVIANGLPSTPGNHGWIEYKVEINAKNGLEEDESGKVNFRESKYIPSVEKGEIVAQIHPLKPGVPGVTVTNEPLPPKQSYPIILKTGKGLIEVDGKVVATESGRPSFEQRGLLVKASIVPKLIHRGNVDLSTGNVRFSGDVEIFGEVEENMLVDADGDIFVHKSVSYANLITLNSIMIKGNVFSSNLAAGKSNMLIVELGHLLGIMHNEVERMMTFILQLSQSTAFKSDDFSVSGLQPLIKILIEKRFHSFVENIKKYQGVVNRGEKYLEKEWINVGYDLKRIFLNLTTQVITMERLKILSNQMKELSEFSELPVEPNAFITISEANNSTLYCSGNINVIGKGSINTKIHAGGQLDIRGVVRGGEIYGRLGVVINEVGSYSGTKTIVLVPDDQSIQIQTAFEGTVLKIGNVKRVLHRTYHKLNAKLDHSGEMILNEE